MINPTINCWSLTSSPPPPHQITPTTSPNQSPTHQLYQHTPITNITNITNISYPAYYNQDITYAHYQNPEYIPLLNSEISYTPAINDRTFQENIGELEKVEDYGESGQNQSPNSTTDSNTPVLRFALS